MEWSGEGGRGVMAEAGAEEVFPTKGTALSWGRDPGEKDCVNGP